MELLTPSHPQGPTGDPFSGFTSPAGYKVDLERASCGEVSSSSSSLNLPGIVEGEEESEKVHVAVGRSVDKAVSLLHWTFRKFGNSQICLVHVHRPSPMIPTLLGKLPANQANGVVVAAYRTEERENTRKLLLNYLSICPKTKVKASVITIESEQVQKGLVELISQQHIRKLVMGAVPENCMKMKRSSSKANYAAKNAPPFCEIWFINKGKHVWTREAMEGIRFGPNICQADALKSESLRSKSLRFDKSEPMGSGRLQFHSSRARMKFGLKDWIQDARVQDEEALASLQPLCSSVNNRDQYSTCTSVSPISGHGSGCTTSAERRISLDSESRMEEESAHSQLVEAQASAEASNHEVSVELRKRKELEAQAVHAISKVKDFESSHTHELKLRKEAEEALKTTVQDQERLLEERLEVAGELQKTMRNLAALDSRLQEANRRCDEATGELKLIQASMTSLHQEKLKLRKQKVEAEHWLDRWRSHRQAGGANHNAYIGFHDDMPEMLEFSLFDIQTATCNFSDSFKLGEGGYGSVYKGELLDRTVAIKMLYPQSMLGPSQFQKEVHVLGKLRHPHLVTLVGACPEVWSLVCDYLPNGNLQYHLSHKSITSLTWKDRARIISEISSALLFLHSSHPERIVHGNLKPENILLDSKLHCKICDFGIFRLVTKETLRCPSFRRYAEPQGAFPYSDPESHRTRVLSPKSDVYSFGLIILQLLTRRPPVGLAAEVRKAVSCGKLDLILDSSAGQWPTSVAGKLAEMGLKFCKPNSRDRPELTPTVVRELQQLHTSEERPVPSFFLCPILQEIMHDPVVAADGFTYEAEALHGWLLLTKYVDRVVLTKRYVDSLTAFNLSVVVYLSSSERNEGYQFKQCCLRLLLLPNELHQLSLRDWAENRELHLLS
ncbi:hypothetical protein Nepgr_014127 [Nepenthes gracilis]|uniref:RING-type E3 ubiquitin transferase n=1 Tax=Nepenthes gracilis TaxID=150966 RepID=A0AAD3XQ03_NEPGR|nr:hypothetical protein Nepgr_014127 [Nepenthes gracilis]